MKGHSPERALKSSKCLFAWTYRGTGRVTTSEGQVFLEPRTHPISHLPHRPFPSCLLLTAVEHNGGQRWFEAAQNKPEVASVAEETT